MIVWPAISCSKTTVERYFYAVPSTCTMFHNLLFFLNRSFDHLLIHFVFDWTSSLGMQVNSTILPFLVLVFDDIVSGFVGVNVVVILPATLHVGWKQVTFSVIQCVIIYVFIEGNLIDVVSHVYFQTCHPTILFLHIVNYGFLSTSSIIFQSV